MNKIEKQMYLNAKTLGYWSSLNGLELKSLCNGEYAVVVENAWSTPKKVHKLKINYNPKSDSAYITLNGIYFRFEECIRHLNH